MATMTTATLTLSATQKRGKRCSVSVKCFLEKLRKRWEETWKRMDNDTRRGWRVVRKKVVVGIGMSVFTFESRLASMLLYFLWTPNIKKAEYTPADMILYCSNRLSIMHYFQLFSWICTILTPFPSLVWSRTISISLCPFIRSPIFGAVIRLSARRSWKDARHMRGWDKCRLFKLVNTSRERLVRYVEVGEPPVCKEK